MSLNDGKVHYMKIAEKSEQEREEMARDFSEGSIGLENLLKYLWKNGYNTLACCAGHEERKEDPNKVYDFAPEMIPYDGGGYITIDLTDQRNYYKHEKILANLYKNKMIKELELRVQPVKNEAGEDVNVTSMNIQLAADKSAFDKVLDDFNNLDKGTAILETLSEKERRFIGAGAMITYHDPNDSYNKKYSQFGWITDRLGKHFSCRELNYSDEFDESEVNYSNVSEDNDEGDVKEYRNNLLIVPSSPEARSGFDKQKTTQQNNEKTI